MILILRNGTFCENGLKSNYQKPEKNDAVSMSEIDTAALRGEIRVLKRILDLPESVTREVGVFPDN